MIIQLLLLLPALFHSSSQSKVELIDWTQCKITTCFCRTDLTTSNLVLTNTETSTTFSEQCKNIGVQSKFFTADIALFQINVIGTEADNLGDEPKIMFVDGAKETFGCKYNKKEEKMEIAGKDTEIANYKLSLFEDRSQFKKGEFVCAVIMELAFKFKPQGSKQFLRLNFATDQDFELLGSPRIFYLRNTEDDAIKCNPFLFQEISVSDNYFVKPIMNRDSDHLNCDNHNVEPGIVYKMKYNKKKEGLDMLELECKKITPTSPWSYHLLTDVPGGVPNEDPIPNPEAYTFYCAIPFNEMCKQPACTPNGNHACPVFNKSPKIEGKPPTLECDDRKWVLDGKYYELAAQPECQKDEDSTDNGSAFIAKLPSGSPHLITGSDRCFKEYDCSIKSFLDLPSQADEDAGGGIEQADVTNTLRCANQSRVMRVSLGWKNLVLNDTSYVCNKATGVWYNDTTTVPEGASVSCLDTHVEYLVMAAKHSETTLYLYIVGAFVGAILLLTGCAVAIFCVRNKMNNKHMDHDEMDRMNRDDLIKYVNEEFDKVLVARPATSTLIIDGMEMIESMLKSEAYNTDCWAKVYMFLIRLRNVLSKTDSGVFHMVNRYLFLQAAKIIEKRGWLAEKPVLNSSEELMRVVAIRLLVFPLFDLSNDAEAQQLLIAGFRRLGWRGGTQYPHAGVLWSVIAHTLPRAHVKSPESTIKDAKRWKLDGFLERLREFAYGRRVIKMADVMVLQEFRTIREQAAFALGCVGKASRRNPFKFRRMLLEADPNPSEDDLPKAKNPESKAPEIPRVLIKNPEIPLAVFAGMCAPIEQNPVELVFVASSCQQERNQKTLNQLYRINPEAEWQAHVKKAQKLVVYCGAATEAHKFHVFYGREGVDYSAELEQLSYEQSEFEAAVDRALGDLRKWLAERTDKDEFKKAPVFLENTGENKVDDVIPDQNAALKPLGPSCDGSSASKSEQPASGGPSGASGSSGSKSSSDDAAAAATPKTPDAAAPAAPAAAPAQP